MTLEQKLEKLASQFDPSRTKLRELLRKVYELGKESKDCKEKETDYHISPRQTKIEF